MKNVTFKYQNFVKAYTKLAQVTAQYDQNNDILRDSIIQRFEFTYELAWKTLKAFMEYSGITLNTTFPRSIFKEAYAHKIIDNDAVWIKLLEDRNATSHIYKEELADQVAQRIVTLYVYEFEKLTKTLEENLI